MAAVAVAGCGDEGVTREDFVRQAARVCAPVAAELGPVRDQLVAAQSIDDPARGFAALAAATREAVAVRRPLLDRLDALDRPNERGEEIDAWIAGLRAREAARERLAAAYAAEDRSAVARGSARVDLLEGRAAAFARGYGVPACAA